MMLECTNIFRDQCQRSETLALSFHVVFSRAICLAALWFTFALFIRQTETHEPVSRVSLNMLAAVVTSLL